MTLAKTRKIGVIAEDKSDFETVRAIIERIPSQSQITLKKAFGKGCTRIYSKGKRMVADLKQKNCDGLIVIHDLDDNAYEKLMNTILRVICPCPIDDHIVIIPIKAIEAWLLTDMNAIQEVFNYTQSRIKEISNTETIDKPKVHLQELVRIRIRKRYLNTVHNSKIASRLDLNKALKCQSFIPLFNYINNC